MDEKKPGSPTRRDWTEALAVARAAALAVADYNEALGLEMADAGPTLEKARYRRNTSMAGLAAALSRAIMSAHADLASAAKGEPPRLPLTMNEELWADGIRWGMRRAASMPKELPLTENLIEQNIPDVLGLLRSRKMKELPEDICPRCQGYKFLLWGGGNHYTSVPCDLCGGSGKANPKGDILDLQDAILKRSQVDLADQLVCPACKNANWAWYGPMDSGELRPCHACNPDGARARQAMVGGVDESATPTATDQMPPAAPIPQPKTQKRDYCVKWTGHNWRDIHSMIYDPAMPAVAVRHGRDASNTQIIHVEVLDGAGTMLVVLPVGHWLVWDRGMLLASDTAPHGYNTGG